jgi:plasmid stabilization system protein ParE
MEVRWSLPAAEDLEQICQWIERDNPEAARRVAKTIYGERGHLKDFPNTSAVCPTHFPASP